MCVIRVQRQALRHGQNDEREPAEEHNERRARGDIEIAVPDQANAPQHSERRAAFEQDIVRILAGGHR